MSEKKRIISMTLDPRLIEQIDMQRGSRSRSLFVENKLRESLEVSRIKQLVLESCDQILDYLTEKTPPNVPQKVFPYHAFIVAREIEKRLHDLKAQMLK